MPNCYLCPRIVISHRYIRTLHIFYYIVKLNFLVHGEVAASSFLIQAAQMLNFNLGWTFQQFWRCCGTLLPRKSDF